MTIKEQIKEIRATFQEIHDVAGEVAEPPRVGIPDDETTYRELRTRENELDPLMRELREKLRSLRNALDKEL